MFSASAWAPSLRTGHLITHASSRLPVPRQRRGDPRPDGGRTWRAGGLRRAGLKHTARRLVATVATHRSPAISGFFSKDRDPGAGVEHARVRLPHAPVPLPGLSFLGPASTSSAPSRAITSFYMWRCYRSPSRPSTGPRGASARAPWVMTLPWVLAGCPCRRANRAPATTCRSPGDSPKASSARTRGRRSGGAAAGAGRVRHRAGVAGGFARVVLVRAGPRAEGTSASRARRRGASDAGRECTWTPSMSAWW